MEALQKLKILGPAAKYEPAEEVNMVGQKPPPPSTRRELAGCISHATLPGGKRIPMLKTLLSSTCEMNCRYCAFRAGRDVRRATFIPDELAYLTNQLYTQNVIQGIFLSSGLVGGGTKTQDRIIDAATILRQKYQYTGYLHMKIMPGAERDQIAAAMQLADRVSLNLEAPNAQRLAKLAPRKEFSQAMLQRLRWIYELRRSMPGKTPSAATQFVVGPAGESDLELLNMTAYLYRELNLARTYFSRFSPVPNTPLQEKPATQHKREQRLYQASFLLRDYGFEAEELPYTPQGNLPLEKDPKTAWAQQNLNGAPVEVNTAERELLLRVPGIGLKSAERILRARRLGTLQQLSDLRKLGIATKRAENFILLNGKSIPRQLTFWKA